MTGPHATGQTRLTDREGASNQTGRPPLVGAWGIADTGTAPTGLSRRSRCLGHANRRQLLHVVIADGRYTRTATHVPDGVWAGDGPLSVAAATGGA